LRAFELGYKVHAAKDLTGSIATFYNLYDDLRSFEPGTPGSLANGLKALSDGTEAAAGYQVSGPWRLGAG